MIRAFWAWYERTYTVQISIALSLFLLQIIHLVWLFGQVVWVYLFGTPLFTLEEHASLVLAVVDYTEIPALLSVSLVYINELRKGWNTSSALYLVFLNSQWVHLFWITDEFVVSALGGMGVTWNPLLAFAAVAIDYLEVPVMVDTIRRFVRAMRKGDTERFLREDFRKE
jgi:hypothetical protein